MTHRTPGTPGRGAQASLSSSSDRRTRDQYVQKQTLTAPFGGGFQGQIPLDPETSAWEKTEANGPLSPTSHRIPGD